jgi:hypothetical protein
MAATAGQKPRLAIAHSTAPNRMSDAAKREIGKRNEDGGDPHLCMALARFR